VLAGSLVLVGVLAAVVWNFWVPRWRPSLRHGERYGIDVSAHQHSIDWKRVAGDDIKFAYIKATEGRDFFDDRFDRNWREAGDAGLDRGAYHFFTLCTPGADQANHFLTVAAPDPKALAPAVDLELAGNCHSRPEQASVAKELDDFITTVETAWGRKMVLYVSDDFESRYPASRRPDHPLWHQRFLLRPGGNGWVIWQAQGSARVDGISGGVDLDVTRQ